MRLVTLCVTLLTAGSLTWLGCRDGASRGLHPWNMGFHLLQSHDDAIVIFMRIQTFDSRMAGRS